jgi:hypothetical protein
VAAGVVDIIHGTHVVNLWKVVIERGPSFLQIDTRIWGLMVLTCKNNKLTSAQHEKGREDKIPDVKCY